MKRSKNKFSRQKIFYILLTSIIISALIFIWPAFLSGLRDTGVVESIYGIPFPSSGENILITQNLAHFDAYLLEPVFAKKLSVNIQFIPHDSKNISLGIREKSFWLSYNPVSIYANNTSALNQNEIHTKIIQFPLTDKFQESNKSIDLMFFTNNASADNYDLGLEDRTHWEIVDMRLTVSPTLPSLNNSLKYLLSILMRERAA